MPPPPRRDYARLLHLTVTDPQPSAAFIGWLAGAWLDGRLHQHWIGIAGIVVGGVSGLIYVIRLAMTTMGGVRIVDKNGNQDENGSSDEPQ